MNGPLRALLLRLRGLGSSWRFERGMAEELEHDLLMMIADGEHEGLSAQEARRQALVKLGGLEQTKQACRNRRTLPMLEASLHDARFAMRQLRARPGFTVTAILMLALGIGASTAIFSFVDAALLKPLPYPEPQRLVWTTEIVDKMGPANLSWQDYEDWKRNARSFRSLAVWRYAGFLLKTGDGVAPAQAMRVSANFLHTLGVSPILGRDFQESDNLAGAASVAMLSYGAWQQQFGGRADLVGQTIQLDGTPYVVIGILPKGFEFAPRGPMKIITALRPEAGTCEVRRSCHALNGVARLNDGVTVAAASAEVKRIAAELEREYPASNRGQGGIALPLAEQVTGKIRPVLYTLLAASIMLFVIASLNVASLLLARSDSRSREFAVRSALGASKSRLLLQFGTESLVLMSCGLVAGLVGAAVGLRLIFLLIPADMRAGMTFLNAVHLSRHTLLFSCSEAVVTGLVFAFLPVLQMRFATLRAALSSGTSGGGSLSWRRVGSQIVVLEVAMAVVLLVSAGLLSRSLLQLLHVDLAFDSTHLATISVAAPDAFFKTDAQKVAIQQQVAERFRKIPGVTAVGFGQMLPASYNGNTDWIRFVGKPYDGHHNEVNSRTASPAYLQTLGVKLLRGRFFTPEDNLGKPRVVIVNRKLAEQYYPGEDPIGKQFGDTDLSPKSMRQIVGVIENLHEGTLDDEMWAAEYEPAYQQVDLGAAFVVRTQGDEHTLLPELLSAVHEVNLDLGVSDEVTMGDRIHDSQGATLHRGAALLVGAFALLALLLSAVGLYGVVMYSVSLRTRELGIRMALGSPRRAIYQLVLSEAGWLSAAGLALGLVLAVSAATLLRTMLFQVAAWDASTLIGVCVLLVLCSFIASFLPARRAATVDPVHALRTE